MMFDRSIDAMRIALRVLNAVINGRPPHASDIDALHSFAPLLADGPADKLAFDVIQEALWRRAQLRRSAAEPAG